MSEGIHEQEVAALEGDLTALTPAPLGIDRDRLMFRAGRDAAKQPSGFWPWATAATSFIAAILAIVLVTDLGAAQRKKSASSGLPDRSVAASRLGGRAGGQSSTQEAARLVRQTVRTPYLDSRNLVLSRGLDGLPPPPATPDRRAGNGG